MDNILQVNNLTKNYGELIALNSVSFTVPEGKIVGLLGPNGSGKTTLIKIVTGLIQSYKGEALIDGMKPGPETKALVSYLPDRDILPQWMGVSRALDMFSDFYADFDRKKCEEMLSRLDVSSKKRVGQLSKGMREKLQLSITMSRRARLYILDEPIAGVDPAARDLILSTILNNYSEKSAILLSTHIISDVESIFDTAIFLKTGEIYLADDCEALRQKHGMSIDGLFREVFKC